ncbi:MAG: hypothetical protein AB200_01165 [Parcubacteria bacterium C7867-005]|nr:MAG: hypothetical protein AB200_01165 [Parcubacteria bacterium C7867-005]
MIHRKSELYFLIVLLSLVFILIFSIFWPFLYSLILAVVFATVFDPLHKYILSFTGGKRGLSAILSVILVFILVILPISFFASQIFQEASTLYFYLMTNEGSSTLTLGSEGAINGLKYFVPNQAGFSIDLSQYAREGLAWLIPHLSSILSNLLKIVVGVFVFLIALYFSFKDGQAIKKTVLAMSPLKDNHDEEIFKRLSLAVNSVIKGILVVAIVQGALTSLGFLIFGVPSALLWGSVAAIAAMIPGFGTSLVIGPAIIYLFVSGSTYHAVGLFVWGVTAVGLVDNFLGPKLLERGMHIHPFLILLSILGGLGLFGPLGFLLGPLALGLLFALLDIYFIVRKEWLDTGSV